MSHVTCHMSPVPCQVSLVRCHVSGVRCQIFYFTKWVISQWRFYYQRGLPRLVHFGSEMSSDSHKRLDVRDPFYFLKSQYLSWYQNCDNKSSDSSLDIKTLDFRVSSTVWISRLSFQKYQFQFWIKDLCHEFSYLSKHRDWERLQLFLVIETLKTGFVV